MRLCFYKQAHLGRPAISPVLFSKKRRIWRQPKQTEAPEAGVILIIVYTWGYKKIKHVIKKIKTD